MKRFVTMRLARALNRWFVFDNVKREIIDEGTEDAMRMLEERLNDGCSLLEVEEEPEQTEENLEQIEENLEQIEENLEQCEEKLNQIGENLEQINEKLKQIEEKLKQIKEKPEQTEEEPERTEEEPEQTETFIKCSVTWIMERPGGNNNVMIHEQCKAWNIGGIASTIRAYKAANLNWKIADLPYNDRVKYLIRKYSIKI